MRSTTTKVLAGLLLFASGAVTGYFGSRLLAERGRFALFHGDPRHFSEMVVRRLSDDLDLSAEQQEKLRPIVLNTGDELAKIRREQEPKVRETIDKSIEATKAILTPEQREKYMALMERLDKRRKAMERFGPPPGGPGGPPGPPPGEGGFPPPPPPGMGPPPDFEGFPPPPPRQPQPEGKASSAAPAPGNTSPAPKAPEKSLGNP
jgi:Spy/CpxP family protein refolding chaperone